MPEDSKPELNELARQNRLDARLDANLHPVTHVYCDPDGIIVYERRDAQPISIMPGSPHTSRLEALKRCDALLSGLRREMEKLSSHEAELKFRLPISQSGFGLTYQQYEQETWEACQASRFREDELVERGRVLHQRGI